MGFVVVRDYFWDYPYKLFLNKDSVWNRFVDIYNGTRPFSHIIATVLCVLLATVVVVAQIQIVLGFNKDTFVEGVITGVDTSGLPQGPNKLNPLLVSNTQLDQDIMELIYEPLFKVEQSGRIHPVLVDNYIAEEGGAGKSYRFVLKKNVKWHDGSDFTTADVAATFELLKNLATLGLPDIFGANITTKANLEVLDDYVFRIAVTKELIPNFEELLSFKILPARSLDQYKEAAFSGQYRPEKLVSIGTGPYILSEISSEEVRLTANEKYHSGQPQIKRFVFKLLRDTNEAAQSIKAGQLHGLASVNNDLLSEVGSLPNMELLSSEVIQTQYWGMYFNLSDNSSPLTRDLNIRKAMLLGLNKPLLIKSLYTSAKIATGTIPENSPYYAPQYQQAGYDLPAAKKLLDESGWIMKEDEYRYKAEAKLSIRLAFVDNPDRIKLTELIAAEFTKLGIEIKLEKHSARDLTQLRLNSDFDLLLYGVNTFVDPDRYEFFHSSQTPSSEGEALNISSYKSSKQTSVIDEEKGKTIRVPMSDKLLEDARRTTDINERKTKYTDFQRLLVEDLPVIFLYHPTIRYYTSKRIKNIDLSKVTSIEERLSSIVNWKVEFN